MHPCILCSQELLPPKFESSSESSEDTDSAEEGLLGFDDPWSLGDVPEKMDMSDLWVTEDTAPLTSNKGGKKYSTSQK